MGKSNLLMSLVAMRLLNAKAYFLLSPSMYEVNWVVTVFWNYFRDFTPSLN